MTDVVVVQPETQLLIVEQSSDSTSIVIETGAETNTVTIDVGMQGPAGPAGPAGDGSTVSKVAGSAIGGHKVVIASGQSHAELADKDTASHTHVVLGVTKGAATSGSNIDIALVGELIEPSWSWLVGPVFLGNNGNLTQTTPTTGFLLQIGTAIAPTVLMIKIGAPISLT